MPFPVVPDLRRWKEASLSSCRIERNPAARAFDRSIIPVQRCIWHCSADQNGGTVTYPRESRMISGTALGPGCHGARRTMKERAVPDLNTSSLGKLWDHHTSEIS